MREVCCDLGVFHPRDRLQLALRALGVGDQDGRTDELVDDDLHRLGIGVDVAGDRHLLGADREQGRSERRQGGDGENQQDQHCEQPLQPLTALGALDGQPALAHPRLDAAPQVAIGLRRERVGGDVVLDEDDRARTAAVEAALDVHGVGQVVGLDRDHRRFGGC